MNTIRNNVAQNLSIEPGQGDVEINTILDLNAGRFGYEQIKLLIYSYGNMPAGSVLTIRCIKQNIGVIEKVDILLDSDVNNNSKMFKGVLTMAHLADEIRANFKIKRNISEYRLTAMIQLTDRPDNVLSGTHEMVMVKREF